MSAPAIRLALLLVGVLSGLSGAAARRVRFVDSAQVQVGNEVETWGLAWVGETQPVCELGSEDYETCPCEGFRFGRFGRLRLYRFLGETAIDSLWMPAHVDEAEETQFSPWDQETFIEDSAHLGARRTRTVFEMKDYSGDGTNGMFAYRIGSEPCGHSQWAVVGVTRKELKLHVLGRDGEPYVLDGRAAVEGLAGRDTSVQNTVPCGDHAAELSLRTIYLKSKGDVSVESYHVSCLEEGGGTEAFPDSLRRKIVEGSLQANRSFALANCIADEMAQRYPESEFLALFADETRVNAAFSDVLRACHENNPERSREWFDAELE